MVWSADKRQIVLSLPNSKGAKLTNVGEYVVFADPLAVRFFHMLTFSTAGHEPVFQISFSALSHDIRRTANALGIHGNGLTPYVLRRGGATWHFGLFKSLDASSAYGRWGLGTTARRYVSQTMADMQQVTLSDNRLSRILKLRQVLPYLAFAQR